MQLGELARGDADVRADDDEAVAGRAPVGPDVAGAQRLARIDACQRPDERGTGAIEEASPGALGLEDPERDDLEVGVVGRR